MKEATESYYFANMIKIYERPVQDDLLSKLETRLNEQLNNVAKIH